MVLSLPNLKTVAGNVLPRPVVTQGRSLAERAELFFERKKRHNLSRLLPAARIDLTAILSSSEQAAGWKHDSFRVKEYLPLENLDGAINPGDRRALYSLIAALKPRRVLEIGTHVGASTIAIAQALERYVGSTSTITTVDILDVNDPKCGAHGRLGLQAPISIVAELGLSDHVEFVTSPALDFLLASSRHYDLIFLDGDHSARAVYQEISASLGLLNQHGVILLHDYFPENQPLWHDYGSICGPWLAVKRLQVECPDIQPVPLGALPWETKPHQNVTSLALLLRSEKSHEQHLRA
jgi:predicted O-methyltransferase YrrM